MSFEFQDLGRLDLVHAGYKRSIGGILEVILGLASEARVLKISDEVLCEVVFEDMESKPEDNESSSSLSSSIFYDIQIFDIFCAVQISKI